MLKSLLNNLLNYFTIMHKKVNSNLFTYACMQEPGPELNRGGGGGGGQLAQILGMCHGRTKK